ncbi:MULTISPECIES: Pr6Pr family membrane protein [unclassified Mesorhizobium]|uniref:Pr6Pr family membrane protein n=1 Tax=unclassified Mesorhizobium TaxID=325217 RepID=UPI00112C3460|nr:MULTISPECIES: Pr6Pr family membrane protein [unclassified Mesorhizobium]TPL01290.1 flagellar basal body P-ring protein FlgI [Mesorhizobium sp. B2-4-16]TPL71948.1 flagellar basal body P-ring protein FlgI [Mesorhizobium sp. B2-4-3]
MGRFLQMAGLVVGLIALVLQFAITVPASMAAGRGLLGSIVFYFSFFTILTNIAAVMVHASLLSPAGYAWFPAFAGPRIRTGVAVAMTLVFIVYATVLARLWQPQGLFLFCDVLLHYVTPVLFVLWWLVAGADGRRQWSDIAWWMIYPVAYLAYALMRAPFAGEVPYPFLDIAKNGAASVAISALAVTALFVGLSVLAVLVDHGIGRSRGKPATRVQSSRR